MATAKRAPSPVGWSDASSPPASLGEERGTEFKCAVADAIQAAYRSDGAPEDMEAFVGMGDLGMFGVFVAASPKSVASFRLKEIAQEARALFERRLAEEMDAFEERLPR